MSYPPEPPSGYYGGAPVAPVPTPPTTGKAITALVLGIVALMLCGFFLGIPAVIVGLMARAEIRRSEGRLGGDGLALVGIITGIIGVVWSVVALVLVVGLFAFGSTVVNDADRACDQIAASPNAAGGPTQLDECFDEVP